MWVPLQKVNPQNWNDLTLTLPLTSWKDLQNLEVKIENIPTTLAATPTVYLDGMFVEVHYDVPPAFTLIGGENVATSASSSPQVIEVNPSVSIETPAVNAAPFLPPPTIVGITTASDTVTVTVQYVGDFYGGNPLQLFVYPAGTAAERNDAASGGTFAGVPNEGPFVNGIPITQDELDASTKQATIPIVGPSIDPNVGIRTAAMASGIYAVDIAYYDGNIWHLISPQNFTWQ